MSNTPKGPLDIVDKANIGNDVLAHIIDKAKYAQYGSLAASGGQILLLITALQVLGDHGSELEGIRDDARRNETQKYEYQSEAKLALAKLAGMVDGMDLRLREVERLVVDPHARPDSWTRSDDTARMNKYEERIKAWIANYHKANTPKVSD